MHPISLLESPANDTCHRYIFKALYSTMEVSTQLISRPLQHYPFWTNLVFACKTETLGSLYSHVLIIIAKSSKSKNQVVHEKKFKGLLSSTCLTSSEGRLLDLESEVIRGLGSISTVSNILSLDIFCIHTVETKMPILGFLSSL